MYTWHQDSPPPYLPGRIELSPKGSAQAGYDGNHIQKENFEDGHKHLPLAPLLNSCKCAATCKSDCCQKAVAAISLPKLFNTNFRGAPHKGVEETAAPKMPRGQAVLIVDCVH